MPTPGEIPLRFVPRTVSDALDGDNVSAGACRSLANLLFDPSTPGVLVCRPANLSLTTFGSFTTPGVISCIYEANNLIYGMIASGRNAGKDEPFCYNPVSNTFVSVSGITSANSPTTQSTTGDWVPPTMSMVGGRLFVTHPGFNFAGGYAFGFFDMTGFSGTPTGDTTNTSKTIANMSSTAGLSPGYTITGTGIPANTVITAVTSTTITISNAATATNTGTTLTIAGGTAAAPLWCAGNTSGTALASIALAVHQFNNRAYFATTNNAVLTDTLSTNVTNASGVQVLTIDDSSNIIGFAGLPFYATTGGTIQALIVFKNYSIWQITGDPATSNLSLNQLSGSTGTFAPRTICPTPSGIMFMANDGVREITLTGNITEPDKDLALPFIYALHPSRAAAAFNADIYRICVQNGNALNSPYEDYYYYPKKQGWTGPHNFRVDCAVPYGSDFIVCNNAVSNTLWQSYSVQNRNSTGNTFTENGTALTWTYETCPMSDIGNMYANTLCRSTMDIAEPATGDTYLFQILDANGGIQAQASLVMPNLRAVWNSFNWGASNWGAAQYGLEPYSIPWNQPAVFNQPVFQAQGNSSLGLKLGSVYNGYKQLGYLLQ